MVAMCVMTFMVGITYHGVSSYLPKNHILRVLDKNTPRPNGHPSQEGSVKAKSFLEEGGAEGGGPSPRRSESCEADFGHAGGRCRLPIRTAIIGVVASPVEMRRYSEKKTMTTFVVEMKKVRIVNDTPRPAGTRAEITTHPALTGTPLERGGKKTPSLRRVDAKRTGGVVNNKSLWVKTQGKIKVNAYNIVPPLFSAKTSNGGNVPLQYGDEIRLWGELKLPPRAMNPGQFDYREYLARQGVHVLMNVYGQKCVRNYTQYDNTPRSNGHPSRLLNNIAQHISIKNALRSIFTLRTRIKATIDTHIKYPYNTILNALLIGERREIPSTIRDIFVKTGTVHVLAISGLHISIMTGMLFFALARLGCGRFVRVFVSVAFLIFYSALAGFRFPIIRATIMGIIVLIGFLCDHKRHSVHALFITLMCILLYNPESIFLVGLQLSFLAVFSILILTPHVRALFPKAALPYPQMRAPQRLVEYIISGYAISCAVLLGSVPIVAYNFNIFSLCSLFANIIVVPCAALIILSGIVCVFATWTFAGSALFMSQAPELAIKGLIFLLRVFGSVPGSFFYIQKPHLATVLGYYTVLGCTYIFRKRLFRHGMISVMATACVVFIAAHTVFRTSAEHAVHFLSRGNQNIAVLSAERKTILVNTGYPSHVEWVIKPFLTARGVSRIDALIITSAHKRNWGGLTALQRYFTIKKIIVPPVAQLEGLTNTEIPIEYMQDAADWDINGFMIQTLRAPQSQHPTTLSETAVSLWVRAPGFEVLFLSDIVACDIPASDLPRAVFGLWHKNDALVCADALARFSAQYYIYNTTDHALSRRIKICAERHGALYINPARMGYARIPE